MFFPKAETSFDLIGFGKSYSSRCEVADMHVKWLLFTYSSFLSTQHICAITALCLFSDRVFLFLLDLFFATCSICQNFLKIVFSSLEKDTIIYGEKT